MGKQRSETPPSSKPSLLFFVFLLLFNTPFDLRFPFADGKKCDWLQI